MFGRKKKAWLTPETRRYVEQTCHKVRWRYLATPEESDVMDRTQVAVPGSLVAAAWALQDAVMAINRDQAIEPTDPTSIDAQTRMHLDGIRANLSEELQTYTSYRLTKPT